MLRTSVIPAATGGAGVHVGGATAANGDLNTLIAGRLAPLIGGVVVVSMLLLLVAFRSVVIAATAAVMNTLSVAAAYGVAAYFLEGGWAGGLVGIDTATPMAARVEGPGLPQLRVDGSGLPQLGVDGPGAVSPGSTGPR